MARRTKLDFIYEENSGFMKLTMKMAQDKQLKDYSAILSENVHIPEGHILVTPDNKLWPIGLLLELDFTIADLVDKYGTTFKLNNQLTEPVELSFTTKTVLKNRWNSFSKGYERTETLNDLLPELAEWAGYPVSDIFFRTDVDENSQPILRVDYTLTIPDLVAKYGADFELISRTWTGGW